MSRSKKSIAKSLESAPPSSSSMLKQKTGSEIWEELLSDPDSHELLEELSSEALKEYAEGKSRSVRY